MRFAEISPEPFRGRTAALMTRDRDRHAPEIPDSGDDRPVVGKTAIAVNLEELADQGLDIVERLRTGRIARQPHPIDRAEARLELGLQPRAFRRELAPLAPASRVVQPHDFGQARFDLGVRG